MNEKVLFKIEIIVVDTPEQIQKLETKFTNLSLKENVVSGYVRKFYL